MRNWTDYNEKLVRRGKILISYDITQNWDKELAQINCKKQGRKFLLPDSFMKLAGYARAYFGLPYRQPDFVLWPNSGSSFMSVFNAWYYSFSPYVADIRKKITELGYEILSKDLGVSTQDIEARKLKHLFIVGIIFTVPVTLLIYPEVFRFLPLAGTNVAAYIMFTFVSIVQFVTGK